MVYYICASANPGWGRYIKAILIPMSGNVLIKLWLPVSRVSDSHCHACIFAYVSQKEKHICPRLSRGALTTWPILLCISWCCGWSFLLYFRPQKYRHKVQVSKTSKVCVSKAFRYLRIIFRQLSVLRPSSRLTVSQFRHFSSPKMK